MHVSFLLKVGLFFSIGFSPLALGEISTVLDSKALSRFDKVAQDLKKIPVYYEGRLQPLDTFARDTVRLVTGEYYFQKKDPIHLILSWIILPQYWNSVSFIQIKNNRLKQTLNLNSDSTYFSPIEIFSQSYLESEIIRLKTKRENKEKLDSYMSDVQKLESQLILYQSIQGGHLPFWLYDSDQGQWFNTRDAKESLKSIWYQFVSEYSRTLSGIGEGNLNTEIQNLENQTSRIERFQIQQEVLYNQYQPFRYSWILYLVAVFLFFLLYLRTQIQKKVFFIFLIIPFILHTYGIILRIFITLRPPVTNMYETVIWVPWAALVLAGLFALKYRKQSHLLLLFGAIGAFISLFIADMAYEILGGRLQTLEAVLRSHFWLSTHVLVITISYSAFLLAFIAGDWILFQFLKGRKERDLILELNFLKRCLQLGVLLLAAGTILGGIWADYSWGRFWGWDPKEVWALVALLGYLAVLHARLQGWIRGFGLAICSVAAFFLVLMAWYGVNYVLGAGLHSYGFGRGGLPYVLSFIILHLLFMFGVWRWIKSRKPL